MMIKLVQALMAALGLYGNWAVPQHNTEWLHLAITESLHGSANDIIQSQDRLICMHQHSL